MPGLISLANKFAQMVEEYADTGDSTGASVVKIHPPCRAVAMDMTALVVLEYDLGVLENQPDAFATQILETTTRTKSMTHTLASWLTLPSYLRQDIRMDKCIKMEQAKWYEDINNSTYVPAGDDDPQGVVRYLTFGYATMSRDFGFLSWSEHHTAVYEKYARLLDLPGACLTFNMLTSLFYQPLSSAPRRPR